jgi:hypothetical protein
MASLHRTLSPHYGTGVAAANEPGCRHFNRFSILKLQTERSVALKKKGSQLAKAA